MSKNSISASELFSRVIGLIGDVNKYIGELTQENEDLKAQIAGMPTAIPEPVIAPVVVPIVVPTVVTPVSPSTPEPVITSPKVINIVVDGPLNYRVRATGNPTKYVAEGLMEGAKINSLNGTVTGKAPAAGDYSFKVIATNSFGDGEAEIHLSVLSPSAALPVSVQPTQENIGKMSNPKKGQSQVEICDGTRNIASGIQNFSSNTATHPGKVVLDSTHGYWYQYQMSPVAPNPRWVLIKDPTNLGTVPASVDNPVNGSLRFSKGKVESYYDGAWQ